VNDEVKENEMIWKCSTRGTDEKCLHIFCWNPEGNRSLGRHRYRWEDNIKMDRKEIRRKGVNRTHVDFGFV
jgi:hypothetical protein